MIADGFFFGLGLAAAGVAFILFVIVLGLVAWGMVALLDWITGAPR